LTTAVSIPGTTFRASRAALSSLARKTVGTPCVPATSARAANSPTKVQPVVCDVPGAVGVGERRERCPRHRVLADEVDRVVAVEVPV